MTKRGGHTAFIENWALESWSDSYTERFFLASRNDELTKAEQGY